MKKNRIPDQYDSLKTILASFAMFHAQDLESAFAFAEGKGTLSKPLVLPNTAIISRGDKFPTGRYIKILIEAFVKDKQTVVCWRRPDFRDKTYLTIGILGGSLTIELPDMNYIHSTLEMKYGEDCSEYYLSAIFDMYPNPILEYINLWKPKVTQIICKPAGKKENRKTFTYSNTEF
jgi:hypothetical protein